MTIEKQLDFIIQTLNMAEHLSALEYNENEDVRKVFCLVSGEENLQKALDKEQLKTCNRFYHINHTLEYFIQKNNLNLMLANEYANKVECYSTRNWLKNELVKWAVEQKDIETAERIVAEIQTENKFSAQYLAHRYILEYYASIGDIENFKKKIKPSKLGSSPRYGIESYKYQLLEGIAKQQGIAKAFEIMKDKYFEKTVSIGILRWAAHLLSLTDIDHYLLNYPKVLEDCPTARAELYVLHFREQPSSAIPQDVFEKVLNEVLQTDKTAKCGDMRCRDGLLLDFGASTLIKKQVLACKQHIVSPLVKKELNECIKYNEENKLYIDL